MDIYAPVSDVLFPVNQATSVSAVSVTESIGEYPQKTCDDVTDSVRVVDIRRGNETRIYSENGCIIIEGLEDNDMIRAADRLTYYWLDKLFIQKL